MQRKFYVEHLLQTIPVYPYTNEAALLAGKLNGEQRARGVTVPFADLLIGATALSLGFGILTGNPRHFRLIPGLYVLPL